MVNLKNLPVTITQVRRAFPLRYLFSFCLLGVGAYLFFAGVLYMYVPVILGGAVIVHTELSVRSHSMTVATNKITVRRGVLSRQSYSVYYDDMMDLKVRQKLWQRLLNYGDVFVNNPGFQPHLFAANRMPSPHKVGQLIERMEHNYAIHRHKREPYDVHLQSRLSKNVGK
ncbi:PH domain-containing protein [Candidatus Woesearchaeota archaeon]|nr:PH domain-containing protein [Candidatus Woesearchaeota archaeon]